MTGRVALPTPVRPTRGRLRTRAPRLAQPDPRGPHPRLPHPGRRERAALPAAAAAAHRGARRAAGRPRARRGRGGGRRRAEPVRRRPVVGPAGRKVFIGAGYGLAAVGKVVVAAATVWPVVLVGRVVDRLGKGVRSAPRDALIAASVPRGGTRPGVRVPPRRRHPRGRRRAAARAARARRANGDLRAALWWAVVPATLSALLVLPCVRSGRRRAVPARLPSPRPRGPRAAAPAAARVLARGRSCWSGSRS